MQPKKVLYLLPFFLTSVLANDIRLGYAAPQSKLIFREIKEASPTIWRRSDQITVQTTGNEVITAIYVTDLRDYKDGEATIEDGGVGAKSVTINLKSPAVFRGYHFEVEIYANEASRNERYYTKGGYGDLNAGLSRGAAGSDANGYNANGYNSNGYYKSNAEQTGYNSNGQYVDNSQYGRKY